MLVAAQVMQHSDWQKAVIRLIWWHNAQGAANQIKTGIGPLTKLHVLTTWRAYTWMCVNRVVHWKIEHRLLWSLVQSVSLEWFCSRIQASFNLKAKLKFDWGWSTSIWCAQPPRRAKPSDKYRLTLSGVTSNPMLWCCGRSTLVGLRECRRQRRA